MAHLIDKDALVAEIERRKHQNVLNEGAFEEDIDILYFLDNLEGKEVDLEKKKIEWIEQLCKYFKANYLYVSGHESFISDFRRYAKDLK